MKNASARIVEFAFLCAVLAMPSVALSQGAPPGNRRELVGYVRDPNGTPIDGARIDIAGDSTSTDSRGFFRLFTKNVDTLTITVRRLGFAPIEAQLTARNRQWDSVYVELEPTAQALGSVAVTTSPTVRERWLNEFEERKSRNLGVFITREEIVARNTSKLSDVVRDKRGVQVVHLSSGKSAVRFATQRGPRGLACQPDMFIDGVRARGMELDELHAQSVEAMELYDTFATVPLQFSPQVNSVPCGTIVVWTRSPARANKESKKPPA